MYTCSVHGVCEPCMWWEGTEEALESLHSLGWRRGRREDFGLQDPKDWWVMSVWGVGCTGAHEQLLQNVGLVSAEANRSEFS